MKFKVGCSPLSAKIYAGTLLKDGTWSNNKQEVTNDAIESVAAHLLIDKKTVELDYDGDTYILQIVKKP